MRTKLLTFTLLITLGLALPSQAQETTFQNQTSQSQEDSQKKAQTSPKKTQQQLDQIKEKQIEIDSKLNIAQEFLQGSPEIQKAIERYETDMKFIVAGASIAAVVGGFTFFKMKKGSRFAIPAIQTTFVSGTLAFTGVADLSEVFFVAQLENASPEEFVSIIVELVEEHRILSEEAQRLEEQLQVEILSQDS